MNTTDFVKACPPGSPAYRAAFPNGSEAPKQTPKRSKFNAKKTTVDGHIFDSRKEAAKYEELKLLMKSGDIRWFCIQPQFILEGGTYRADFLVIWDKFGGPEICVYDVKSPATKTATYRRNKRAMRERYGIEIEEV